MDRLAAIWERLRLPPHLSHAGRTELIIAIARLFLAISCSTAIFIEPIRPTPYVHLAHSLIAVYVLYSIVIYFWVRTKDDVSQRFRVGVHIGDVVWISTITVLTEGPNSAFFVFVTFLVMTAAFRWDVAQTVATGAVLLLLMAAEALAVGYGNAFGSDLEVDRLILRAAYLVLVSALLSYFAHAQKRMSEELKTKAAEMERAAVAREIHDTVIQTLLGIEMEMEAVRAQYPAGNEVLERLQRLTKEEILALRELLAELRPLEITPRELINFISRLLDTFERDTGISGRFVCEYKMVPFSSKVCTELGRIMQEALANIRKHSRASNVVVQLFRQDNDIWKLAVLDDGRGFGFEGRLTHAEMDEQWKGPMILKERVRLIGGELTLESRPNRGSSLEITIPTDGSTRKSRTTRLHSHTDS